ncbi:MAG TPA: CHAP domain-containing protein [Polyangiaceae bacterium]
MQRVHERILLLTSFLFGCAGPDPTTESVERAVLAMDVCGETVPADRAVDGIPAYAQCDDTTNASIWSNNGIDTSTTSLGNDWIQTQRGGGYQCTEFAYRYMHFRWQVDYRHGDAREWCDGDLPSTLVKTTTPTHGDLMVFDAGVCGADDRTGHIVVVDVVDTSGSRVTIVEENRAGRRSANTSCATCFLHAVANDGSPPTAGNGGGGAGGSTMGGGEGGAPIAGAGAGAIGGRPTGGGEGGTSNAGSPSGGREPVAGAGGAGRPGESGGGAAVAGGGTSTGGAGAANAGAPNQSGAGSSAAATSGGGTGGGSPGTSAGATHAAGQPQAAAGAATTGNPDAPADTLSESESSGGCGVATRGAASPAGWLSGLLLGFVAVWRRRPRLALAGAVQKR